MREPPETRMRRGTVVVYRASRLVTSSRQPTSQVSSPLEGSKARLLHPRAPEVSTDLEETARAQPQASTCEWRQRRNNDFVKTSETVSGTNGFVGKRGHTMKVVTRGGSG
jgi:hypothetical protein